MTSCLSNAYTGWQMPEEMNSSSWMWSSDASVMSMDVFEDLGSYCPALVLHLAFVFILFEQIK